MSLNESPPPSLQSDPEPWSFIANYRPFPDHAFASENDFTEEQLFPEVPLISGEVGETNKQTKHTAASQIKKVHA